MDLFGSTPSEHRRIIRPLAERMRPKSLDEFVGQEHLLGPGKLLRGIVEAGKLHSLILWAPPEAARPRWPGSSPARLAQLACSPPPSRREAKISRRSSTKRKSFIAW